MNSDKNINNVALHADDIEDIITLLESELVRKEACDDNKICGPKTGPKDCHQNTSPGLTCNGINRSCDRLRCLGCDHEVLIFDDKEWTKNTDYLFLRNNYPDADSLKKNLRAKRNSRAFCCQCSWTNATRLTRIDPTKINWICTRHPT
nr:unnamed protein product [Spirometra erinaceieuropaei]